MGIPSYFSYIIKNHTNIISQFKCQDIYNLYMDCNSIIYDAVNSTIYNGNNDEYELIIMKKVVEIIQSHINTVKPKNITYIAFDGVAPLAKMEQQKTRRYKSAFTTNMSKNIAKWNNIKITPSTQFMNKLSNFIHGEFDKYSENIIVSTSNEAGEGEHKMFHHIRCNKINTENVAVYGLDSDLIMLSIFHYRFFKNIFICREAPQFMLQLMNLPNPEYKNQLYLMDVKELAKSILYEMDCVDNNITRIYDYVFICFMLGNDFLPHFPAINIRTRGIQILLDTYISLIKSNTSFFLLNDNSIINWKCFHQFIKILAKNEQQYIIDEYKDRNIKWSDSKFWSPPKETDSIDEILLNIPVMFRNDEKYICPIEENWEERYYNILFQPNFCKEAIVINYLEGLEWVLKYYTGDCPDWRWKYNYHYPPLLIDLIKYIPKVETQFITKYNKPFNSKLQLLYVIPPVFWKDLNVENRNLTIDEADYYFHSVKPDFSWAFSRYFWEAKILYPEIPLRTLEKWNEQLFSPFNIS